MPLDDGSKVKYRFKGQKDQGGAATEHYEGIPARSLTGDEYDALSTEDRKTVRESPLYSEVGAAAAPTAKEKALSKDAPTKAESPASPVKE